MLIRIYFSFVSVHISHLKTYIYIYFLYLFFIFSGEELCQPQPLENKGSVQFYTNDAVVDDSLTDG